MLKRVGRDGRSFASVAVVYPACRWRASASWPTWIVVSVTAETVEFSDHEHVARPQGAQAAVESGPVGAYAGREVVVARQV